MLKNSSKIFLYSWLLDIYFINSPGCNRVSSLDKNIKIAVAGGVGEQNMRGKHIFHV